VGADTNVTLTLNNSDVTFDQSGTDPAASIIADADQSTDDDSIVNGDTTITGDGKFLTTKISSNGGFDGGELLNFTSIEFNVTNTAGNATVEVQALTNSSTGATTC
jgi:hypothetical protein